MAQLAGGGDRIANVEMQRALFPVKLNDSCCPQKECGRSQHISRLCAGVAGRAVSATQRAAVAMGYSDTTPYHRKSWSTQPFGWSRIVGRLSATVLESRPFRIVVASRLTALGQWL